MATPDNIPGTSPTCRFGVMPLHYVAFLPQFYFQFYSCHLLFYPSSFMPPNHKVINLIHFFPFISLSLISSYTKNELLFATEPNDNRNTTTTTTTYNNHQHFFFVVVVVVVKDKFLTKQFLI